MLAVLQYVLSDFWRFIGTCILLTITAEAVTNWITFLSANIRGRR